METTAKEKTRVMVNGLPGKMAVELTKKLIRSDRFKVLPCAFTGSEIELRTFKIDNLEIELIKPDVREKLVNFYGKPDISVDFTHPTAVNSNADFYCRHGLHFVMGTTGGDRTALEERVRNSDIVAVIAANMAKQIVAFQAMMKYAAESFPNVFKGYSLEIVESHQKAKADPSGTAKALIKDFKALGIQMDETVVEHLNKFKMEKPEDIFLPIGPGSRFKIIRRMDTQRAINIPDEHLDGHGWHTYTLKSEDDGVLMSFTHNVNGRDVYLAGTIDALEFLAGKIANGEKGKVYSMMDVLKGQ